MTDKWLASIDALRLTLSIVSNLCKSCVLLFLFLSFLSVHWCTEQRLAMSHDECRMFSSVIHGTSFSIIWWRKFEKIIKVHHKGTRMQWIQFRGKWIDAMYLNKNQKRQSRHVKCHLCSLEICLCACSRPAHIFLQQYFLTYIVPFTVALNRQSKS